MHTDFVIIGGGISGASAAYFLSSIGSVTLLERETQFGSHSSGRTAGQFTVGITADTMRAMAGASRSFLASPPAGFADVPLVAPRGSLTVARGEQAAVLDRLELRVRQAGGTAERLDRAQAQSLFPALAGEKFDEGVYEADAMDIDVDALLQGYLRGARRNGATLVNGAQIERISRENGKWRIETKDDAYVASIGINAAGGWADVVAAMAGQEPIGITPYRRTAFTFDLLPGSEGAPWPHVTTADYTWYVKPEAGCFMGSPADATPVVPGEMYPEDIDVARGIHNIEQDTAFAIRRPLNTWAGMRSFVQDRNPVCGARVGASDFLWLVGQGGCGVLTSPAMGQALAAIVQGAVLPDGLMQQGVRAADLSPDRIALKAV